MCHKVVIKFCVFQGLLELSEEQVADLMHLRHLYLTKRALQRKALIHSMATFDSHLVHPSDNSAAAEEVAARLKDIAFEDQAVLYRIARAVWVGVSLSSCQIQLSNHSCLVASRLCIEVVRVCGAAARLHLPRHHAILPCIQWYHIGEPHN